MVKKLGEVVLLIQGREKKNEKKQKQCGTLPMGR